MPSSWPDAGQRCFGQHDSERWRKLLKSPLTPSLFECRSLQISLVGLTKIRAHEVHRTEGNSWVITSKSNLGIQIGSPSDPVGTFHYLSVPGTAHAQSANVPYLLSQVRRLY